MYFAFPIKSVVNSSDFYSICNRIIWLFVSSCMEQVGVCCKVDGVNSTTSGLAASPGQMGRLNEYDDAQPVAGQFKNNLRKPDEP